MSKIEKVFGRGGCVRGPEDNNPSISWKMKKKSIYEEVEDEICVICCGVITDKGHNPYPLSNYGKCCINCNQRVIQERIDRLDAK